MTNWSDKSVLVTGHTGFKGGWLTLLLGQLGARVTGLSLPAPSDPALFDQARVGDGITHIIGDIRDQALVADVVADCRPDVIFHLAAQPLARYSYHEPVETFATNVLGTAHVLDAARRVGGVRAIVAVTSDKCYENREWVWPYRENDPMGGHDPYSASKGAAELVIASFRNSYFPANELARHGTGLASVRAGNVIGGGDWAADRLVPDLIRAFLAGEAPTIRSPGAIRPWQHVLEAVFAYVDIAERLLAGDARVAEPWNFGPGDDDTQPVAWIVAELARLWGVPGQWKRWEGAVPHEAHLLKLDCAKARNLLGWRPTLRLAEALAWIVEWHQFVADGGDARAITLDQINRFRTRNFESNRNIA
ncbi:CDP-glucose 4,6-dehydratase [Sphingomonas sp. IBVSS1]|nr:CDP-glucose 4,6-dehydratase [Sphingomonas sp. IBVSS1]